MEIDYKYTICVLSITFNQAQYIEEALNGFCIQQTNFPFVCVVVDDASTDGEQKVIAKYLEQHFNLDDDATVRIEETDDYKMVFACHRENKNCFFAVYYLKYNHHSIKKTKEPYFSAWRNDAKYVAECEGDDYWIDPLKLQKQVEFMEAHPEHSLCFCAHKELFHSGVTADVLRYETNKEECPMHDMIMEGGGFMATNSMLYRNSMYESYRVWAIDCPIGDLPLMLTLAQKGKVGYIADVMCVYRRMSVGSWSQRTSSSFKKKHKHYFDIKKMWIRFDEYSNKKYHQDVMEKIRLNRRSFVKAMVKRYLLRIKK